jgi:hypothetical protein
MPYLRGSRKDDDRQRRHRSPIALEKISTAFGENRSYSPAEPHKSAGHGRGREPSPPIEPLIVSVNQVSAIKSEHAPDQRCPVSYGEPAEVRDFQGISGSLAGSDAESTAIVYLPGGSPRPMERARDAPARR